MEERYFLRKASDGSWIIKEEFLTQKAEEWAKKFANEGLKRAQLRRFYNEVRSLADRVKDDASFEKVLPLIRMLKPKVAYQKGRKLVPNSFVEFIKICVDEKHLVDRHDFLEGFVKHFEAIVGYHYSLSKD